MDSGFGNFNDFADRVLLGQVPGVSRFAGFGTRTIAVAIADAPGVSALAEDVWEGAAASYPWMLANTSLEAVSDNANDTAAGTGAQSLTASGIDIAGAVVSSGAVPLNGTTAVALPGNFYRINAASVGMLTPVSGKQTNLGTITIRDAGGGTVRAVIPPRKRSAQQAVFTVPAGFMASVRQVDSMLLRASGGATRRADFSTWFRFPNSISGYPREFQCYDGQPTFIRAEAGIPLGPMTDFAVPCIFSSTNGIKVSANFEGILYKI